MNIIGSIALAMVLAFLVESMVEYIFGTITQKVAKLQPYSWLLMYLALGFAVALVYFYQIDLIAWIAVASGWELPASPVGILLTGLVVGRGANYMHQFVTKFLSKDTTSAPASAEA